VIGGIADGVGTIGNAAENIAATNAGKRPGNFGTNLSELGNIVKGGAQIYNSSKRVRVA
jgi:type IV secretory pathway TrbL component